MNELNPKTKNVKYMYSTCKLIIRLQKQHKNYYIQYKCECTISRDTAKGQLLANITS